MVRRTTRFAQCPVEELLRSRAVRVRWRAGVAAAGIAAVVGLVGWAVFPAHSDPSRPAADRPHPGLTQASRPQPSQSIPSQPVPRSSTPGSHSPSPRATPTGTGPRGAGALTSGLRLGVFTAGQPLASFDSQVGQAALVVSYVVWGTPDRWLAHVIATAAASHAEPVLELYPGAFGHNASQIAAGSGGSDAWLRSLGRTIARVGDPVVISFFPEMNGRWRAWWSQSPALYVRAFHHVHQVLSSLAGSLITWFWQPSAMHNSNADPMPWWPGRGYADVVAFDGYYYFPHDTFDAIFGATIRIIRRADPAIPIMIGETAAGPMYGRQAWEITNLFAGIRSHHLLGLVWFNRTQHMQPYQFHQDWRLQDHSAALAAFRACLARYGPLARLTT